MRDSARPDLSAVLATFGSDLQRWPADTARAAREELLRDRHFRQTWEAERRLDATLLGERARLDHSIRESGAMDRLMSGTLALTGPASQTGFRLHHLAAAVLVAAALGGTFDLLFAQGPAAPSAVVVGDNLLFGPDSVEL